MDTNSHTQTLPGGRYVLEKTLGQGAMGVVHSARDRLTGTVVALKRVILDGAGSSPTLTDTHAELASTIAIPSARPARRMVSTPSLRRIGTGAPLDTDYAPGQKRTHVLAGDL